MYRPLVHRGWKRFLGVAALCCAALFSGNVGMVQGQEVVRVLGPGSAEDQPTIQIVESTQEGLRLEFILPALTVEDVAFGGETYQQVAIPGGGGAGAIGQPTLPIFSRFLTIPEGAEVRCETSIEEKEEVPGFRLVPMQAEDGAPFAFDAAAYARSGYGDAPLARADGPASMRGLRVIPLTFSPVQYDPAAGTLRLVRRMRVDVHFTGARFEQVPPVATRPVAPSFDRLYRALVLNYEGPSEGTRVEGGTWLLICPNSADVMTRLQSLIDWRRRQGFPVYIATTAETGTTNTAIKAFIQNAYDHWSQPPEFIVLAGDVSAPYSLPTWFDGVSGYDGEGDLPYVQLDGPDILPDAHIGRLSFNTLTELETIVAKIVHYESTPYSAQTDWFTRACLVGDPIDSGRSTVMLQQWVKSRLRQIGYTEIDTVFNGPFVSQMRTALNKGDTIYCYRGIGGFSGWTNSNTYALTNYDKLFFSVTCTCGTGNFAYETGNTEAFLRAGTPTQVKAAVGAIGTSTNGTHTRYNNCFTFGVYQGLLYEDQWEMGAALTRGKYELYANYQATDPYAVIKFSYWNNLMGDPACRVWSAVPAQIGVSYPASIPLGSNSVTVTVTGPGSSPLPGAQVCLSKGSETFSVGATDAAGVCELPVNASTPGALQLTVSKHNCRPVMADINQVAGALYVGYLSSVIDDDNAGGSQGNGDQVINPAETIELQVNLKNFGTETAPGVSAVLNSEDPYVTVLNGEGAFGDITAGNEAQGSGAYRFSVSGGCPHGHQLRLGLDITSGSNQWHSLIILPVVSADLVATGIHLYESGNGRLDPGESAEISVQLFNQGEAPATGAVGELSSLSPWIYLDKSFAAYGSIPANGTAENTADRFVLRANPATYQGYQASFRLVTTFNGGAVDTTFFSLTVGLPSSDDPTGPDGYGYYAFDNTDTAYPEAPGYSWVEISPALGGDGVQVPLGDYADYQDKVCAVDLPFTFRFYGRNFTRASICSNGWLSMGDTYLTEYRNWNLPGAGAPPNLIAPFWDDLKEVSSTGGHVYRKYDGLNHRWIVEWYHMLNAVGSTYYETFEAILYDPAYYPTPTGDGIILFQYNTVSNIDYVDGYATVGVQNEDHTVGLAYTYFNQYPAGATTLAAGRAIRFLPAGANPAGLEEVAGAPAVFALAPVRPNPFALGTTLAYSLDREGPVRMIVYDAGGAVVRRLFRGRAGVGRHALTWDGRDDTGRGVSSGIYFIRLDAGEKSETRKVVRVE